VIDLRGRGVSVASMACRARACGCVLPARCARALASDGRVGGPTSHGPSSRLGAASRAPGGRQRRHRRAPRRRTTTPHLIGITLAAVTSGCTARDACSKPVPGELRTS
jgi:hypothetical protein